MKYTNLHTAITRTLLVGSSITLLAGAAQAQTSVVNKSLVKDPVVLNSVVQNSETETVIVTATRTEKNIDEVAATVSSITAEQIERQIANNIADLVRYEPGVSVDGAGRFGLSGFTIRGISGDRVLTLVDGTPTADEFSFGPFLSSRRNFVDLDALKAVEIVRGPSSSSYGSNAIGGVVNFISKQPLDYLQGEAFAGSARVNYSSIDESTNTTVLGAFGNETLSGLLVLTQRDFAETSSFFDDNSSGSQRRSPNPQDGENTNLFAKFVYAPSDNQSLTLVAERFDGDTTTDVSSVVGTVVQGVLTNSELGVDERDRTRLSLEYDLHTESTIADNISLLAYYQDSGALQTTFRERLSPSSGIQDRTRSSLYEQENTGIRLQFDKRATIGSSDHLISYGFDYDVSDALTERNGQTINRATGIPAFEFTAFPTRDFPISEYTSQGFFIQDDISLLDGRLNITPAIRHDSFELEAEADAIFLAGNPGSPLPTGFDESKTSLKLGATYDLTEHWTIVGQYAEGFRAPPLDAINVGFTNLAGGYTTLPNPDLEPEEGEGVELGLRFKNEALSVSAVVYQNDYVNFIESLSVLGFNPITRLLEFQARNLSAATIEGFELKVLADLGALSTSLDGFRFRAAFASADGENLEDGAPLNSINPNELVMGLAYEPANQTWGLEGNLTLVERKDVSDIDASGLQSPGAPEVVAFEAPGYGVVDLLGFYNFSESLRLNFAIFNATDKEYFSWSEELVQNPASTNFDRLTQSGRNYSVSVRYQF